MDRYQMVINKIKPTAYRFKSSNSVLRVRDYMKKCIEDKVDFDASNINTAILDPALVKLSQDLNYPIVVDSETTGRSMRIAYGTKKVFSLKSVPNVPHVICYYDVDKKNLINKNIVLKILRNSDGH